jgi:hypothetical protein
MMEASMTELPFEADKRLVKIHQRAISAGLPCAWYGPLQGRSPNLKIRLPDGNSGIVFDVHADSAEAFENIPFEDLVILSRYLAYWNKRQQEIFATVHVNGGRRRDLWRLSQLASPSKDEALAMGGEHLDQLSLSRIFATSPSAEGHLSIQRADSDLTVSLYSPPTCNPILGDNSSAITFYIEGVNCHSEREAQQLLSDMAYAIFFQIDADYEITLQLVERAPIPWLHAEIGRTQRRDPRRLPDRRFTREAVALYMYSRTIRGYPLLEYLTLYQVIEHCMLAFSRSDMIERLRARLEDPSFDINDPVGLSQLLAPERRSRLTNLGEREQVRLTMQTCVTTESVKDFLRLNKEVAEFVSTGQRPLGARSVTIKDGDNHLPVQVADRIYDLRCRIVHAKGESLDETSAPLLPTSSEASQIYCDLILIRFVAQQVLVSCSIPSGW